MTIVEFLEARIAEDSSRAPEFHRLSCMSLLDDRRCNCGYPARVLAECAAKRVILREEGSFMRMKVGAPAITYSSTRNGDMIQWHLTNGYRGDGDNISTIAAFNEMFFDPAPPNRVMRALASVYAGHPDFDPAWVS